MKTAKSAILVNAIFVCLFLLLALAVYVVFFHVYPPSFVQEQPLELQATIQNSKDIEQLRKLALSMDAYEKSRVHLLGASVELIISLSMAVVIVSLLNILSWVKLSREQKNIPLPWWLRWF